MTTQSPVIIIGMHCSGTSLVTHMLEKMGLFVGGKKDWHNEALFFQNLNRWLLRQCGGSWDHPEPIKALLSDQEIRSLATGYLDHMLKSPKVISYLGISQYVKYKKPINLNIPWGWKDPRNTFTLPLWLDIFPQAKIIHIHRHGVDVAKTLQKRREKLLQDAKRKYSRFKSLYWLRPKKGGFTDSIHVGSLKSGLALWKAYLNEARSHVSSLNKQAVEVKFEDLLSDPINNLKILADFAGLPVKQELVDDLVRIIHKNKMYSYRNNKKLKAFAAENDYHLKQHGYSS